MPPRESRQDPASRLFAAYCVAYLSLQIALARRATVDFYDAFVYLCNARRLAGAYVSFSNKPVLLPLLHLPLQVLLNLSGCGFAARIWAPHLLQAALSIACLAAFYAYLSRHFSPRWAQLGVALFSLNRMVIHYFWSVLPDIPSTLLLLLVFLCVDDDREPRGRRAAAAAAALAACTLCRVNMIVAGPLIAAAMIAQGRPRAAIARLAAVTAAGALVFALAHLLVLMRVFSLGPLGAWARMVSGLTGYYATTAGWAPIPKRGYLDALAVSAGLPALALAAAAVALGLMGKLRNAFQTTVLLGYLAVMTFGLSYQESRYILPILPLFYFLLLQALRYFHQRRPAALPRWTPAALIAVVAAASLLAGAREWRRFLDPVYRDPAVVDAARAVAAAAPASSRVFWDAAEPPLLASAAPFTREDPFYYAFYVPNRESLEYLLGRAIPGLPGAPKPGDVVIRVVKSPSEPGGGLAILKSPPTPRT